MSDILGMLPPLLSQYVANAIAGGPAAVEGDRTGTVPTGAPTDANFDTAWNRKIVDPFITQSGASPESAPQITPAFIRDNAQFLPANLQDKLADAIGVPVYGLRGPLQGVSDDHISKSLAYDPRVAASIAAHFANINTNSPASAPALGILNQTAPFAFGGVGAPSPDPAALPRIATPTSTIPVGPSLDIKPPAASGSSTPDIPETSLMGRLGNAFSRIGQSVSDHPQTLMALGAGLAGAPSLGMGISRGLAGAGPASQVDLKQSQQNATIAAMVKRGVPMDVAVSAAANPAIMAQILPQIFGPKQSKFTQIGESATGDKRFGFVDEVSRKVYDQNGKDITNNPGGGLGVPNDAATGLPLQGQGLLDHLTKTGQLTAAEAAGVKGIIEGNMSAAGRNLQKLLPIASLVEPGFTQQTYLTRLGVAKSYTSGKQFQEIQAIGTVAGHLDDLTKAADKLNNFENWGVLNKPLNMLTGAYRDAAQDPRVAQFNTVKQAVSNELSKAYRGGHVTEGDVREWQSNINSIQTPAQLKAVIGQLNDLLASKRTALEEGYKTGMANGPLPAEFRSESERARQKFESVSAWAHGTGPAGGASSAPAPAPAPAPATPAAPMTRVIGGKTYVQQGGKWFEQ